MRKLVKVILISFSPDAHEVGEDPGENQTTVKAEPFTGGHHGSRGRRIETGGENPDPI